MRILGPSTRCVMVAIVGSLGLSAGCGLVFGTEGLGMATEGGTSTAGTGTGTGTSTATATVATEGESSTGDTLTVGTTEEEETEGPVVPCELAPADAFITGTPNASIAALLSVYDDPTGSAIVVGTTQFEVDLGGACESMKSSEVAGFVARLGVDGECLDAAMLNAAGGFMTSAADYNATTGELVVGGVRGGRPQLYRGPLDDLSDLSMTDPVFDINGRIRAVDLGDDDRIIATGECNGTGVLLVEELDVTCVTYPNTVMTPAGLVVNDEGIFIAGSYSSGAEEPLPPAPFNDEAVFIARVTGGDLALGRVDGLDGRPPGDGSNGVPVALAAPGSTLAVAARSGTNLKIVEYDAATLTAGGTEEFASGCGEVFVSDLRATSDGWAVAGGGPQGDAPGCRALGLSGSGEVVSLPLANPSIAGTRPRVAAGCFGVAMAVASPATLYLEYLAP